jgi:hypothetical protein
MAVTAKDQLATDERGIENDDLETALEEREKLKAQAGAVAKRYREADERAKGMLAEFQLTDGEVARCGRFRIAKRAIPGRAVAFETSPTSRIAIVPLIEA